MREVAIGRRDHPNVRLQESSAAEPLELAFLQHAQHLRLRHRAHLGDFVQKQHAAGGQLDLAGFGLLRARERAALVAEELRLEQLLGEGGTVQGHERPAAAGRCPMDVPGDDFLSRAGFTGDQNRRVRLRDLGGLLQHIAPLRRLADDADLRLRFELLGEHLHARLELLGACLDLRGVSLRLDELLVRDRQRDVIGDPACDRQIADRERSRPLRPEGELEHLLTGREPHAEERPVAGRDDRHERVRRFERGQCLGRQVGDDEFLGHRRPGADQRRIREVVRRRRLAHVVAVAIDEDHRQRVVRQHLPGDLGDARKHRADIEDA